MAPPLRAPAAVPAIDRPPVGGRQELGNPAVQRRVVQPRAVAAPPGSVTDRPGSDVEAFVGVPPLLGVVRARPSLLAHPRVDRRRLFTALWDARQRAAGVIIASYAVKTGAHHADYFRADRAWFFVVLLSIGYLGSRGLAKSGSRDHYDA